MELIRAQRNDVHKAIEAHLLRPEDFEWQTTTDTSEFYYASSVPGPFPKLVHIPTESYFIFGGPDEDTNLLYVYFPSPEGLIMAEYESTWPELLKYIHEWLEVVAKEAEPDLWSVGRGSKHAMLDHPEVMRSTEAFTSAEQERLSSSLEALLQLAEEN